MNKKNGVLGIIILLILIISCYNAYALTCEYNSNPFKEERTPIFCTLNNSYNSVCYILISYENDILDIFPKVEYVEREGYKYYYEANDGLFKGEINTRNYYENIELNFEVICSALNHSKYETFNGNITPIKQNIEELQARMIWLKENSGMIVAIICLIILIWILIWLFKD